MWDRKTPSITTMLRGLVGEEIEITCASKDLHSGMFGNAARNPNQVLAEIIASLRAPDGSVTLPGFYDDVAEVPDAVKAQWQGLGFDEKAFLAEAGLSIPAGEQNRSVLEMIWARPTCEINGMIGGYTGDGFKTVIPAKASAKISFRLVSGMDPDKIRAAFRKHVQARVPADCSVTFNEHGGSPAVTVPTDGTYLRQALRRPHRRMGQRGRHHRLGRLHPRRRRFQAHPRARYAVDRLRPCRRRHPQPQREIRPRKLPPRHPRLGAGAGGVRGVRGTPSWFEARKRSHLTMRATGHGARVALMVRQERSDNRTTRAWR